MLEKEGRLNLRARKDILRVYPVPWNLQVIPWRDNVSKGNKLLPHDKIPPKAKSPLAYLKEVK